MGCYCALMLELLFGYVIACIAWMLNTLMCCNAGALVGHVRGLHGVSSTWL